MTTADFKNHKFMNNNLGIDMGIDEQFTILYARVKKLRNGSSVFRLPFYFDDSFHLKDGTKMALQLL